ncbi:MAG TPA: hypothetical protein VNT26_13165 [Candidatus Sulfotelmatobacter sp.]|nr:hypothetical protein [Candidatus Sulfotelmatobacter sp.]
MKQTLWLGLAAAVSLPLASGYAQLPTATGGNARAALPRTEAAPVNLPSNVAEVLKLARTGISEEVILAQVRNSPTAFNLSAPQARYLQDHGVTATVIQAMANRDATLKSGIQPGQLVYRTAVQPAVNPGRVPLPKTITQVHIPSAAVEPAPLPAQGTKGLPRSASKHVSSSQHRAPTAPVPSVYEDPSRPTFPALEDKSDKPWELYPMRIRLQSPADAESTAAPASQPTVTR